MPRSGRQERHERLRSANPAGRRAKARRCRERPASRPQIRRPIFFRQWRGRILMEYNRPQGRVWTKTRGEGCVGRLGRAQGCAGQYDYLGVARGHFRGNFDHDLVVFGNGDMHSVGLHVRLPEILPGLPSVRQQDGRWRHLLPVSPGGGVFLASAREGRNYLLLDPFFAPDDAPPFHVSRILGEVGVVCLDGFADGAQCFEHQAAPRGRSRKKTQGSGSGRECAADGIGDLFGGDAVVGRYRVQGLSSLEATDHRAGRDAGFRQDRPAERESGGRPRWPWVRRCRRCARTETGVPRDRPVPHRGSPSPASLRSATSPRCAGRGGFRRLRGGQVRRLVIGRGGACQEE